MATFKENLKQTFANFKTKYIGNVPEGVTVAQINQHLTTQTDPTIGSATNITTQTSGQYYTLPSDGYISIGGLVSGYRNASIDANGSEFNVMSCVFSDGSKVNSMFMKKGTKVKSAGNDGKIYFTSLT